MGVETIAHFLSQFANAITGVAGVFAGGWVLFGKLKKIREKETEAEAARWKAVDEKIDESSLALAEKVAELSVLVTDLKGGQAKIGDTLQLSADQYHVIITTLENYDARFHTIEGRQDRFEGVLEGLKVGIEAIATIAGTLGAARHESSATIISSPTPPTLPG